MAEVATIGNIGTHQIGGIKQWFKDKTINKVAFMALYYFYPFKSSVKPNTRLAKKIKKGERIMKTFFKHSPFNEELTIKAVEEAIKQKTGLYPTQHFINELGMVNKIGLAPAVAASLIAAAPVVLKIALEVASGEKVKAEDLTVLSSEITSDSDTQELIKSAINAGYQLKDVVKNNKASSTVPNPNYNTGNNTNSGNTGGGNNNTSGNNNTLLYLGLGAAALYLITKK